MIPLFSHLDPLILKTLDEPPILCKAVLVSVIIFELSSGFLEPSNIILLMYCCMDTGHIQLSLSSGSLN